MGFVDKGLDAIVQKLAAQVNDQVNEGLASRDNVKPGLSSGTF
jgi:hypothetical protein